MRRKQGQEESPAGQFREMKAHRRRPGVLFGEKEARKMRRGAAAGREPGVMPRLIIRRERTGIAMADLMEKRIPQLNS